MRKTAICGIFLCIFLITPAICQDDFLSTPIGKEVLNLGLRFLDNPGDFLFNLHSDNLDFTPVLSKRHGTIRTNFYPTTFPLTWFNLNLKVKTISENSYTGWFPQVDIVGQYGRMAAIDMASSMSSSDSSSSSGTVKPQMSDYTAGLLFTKSVDENTRLYAGVNYSNVILSIKMAQPIDFGTGTMSEMNVAVADYFLFTGIENKLGENKYVVAHVGYGFRYQKIVSRVAWYHKHLELGFNIYPEGLFVLHPFMAWHWYF
ncbi:MAG: hypothetical protein ABIJ11_04305 [Elusimicrobiota bacterium]